MCDSTTSNHHGVKTENDGSKIGQDKAPSEVWTRELTGLDILIVVGSNEADILQVKQNDDKKVEIVPLRKPEGLKRVKENVAIPSEEVKG